MKIAVQIPLKWRSSTRVPNKNFRDLRGRPFCHWLMSELVAHLPPEYDLFIDSENESVMDHFRGDDWKRLKFHQRLEWFSQDKANGNHLFNQFALSHPEYDFYVQAYVTAVTLKGEIVREAMEAFTSQSDRYDSMFLVTEETGWIWFQQKALNYDPSRMDGLPRSQDATYLKETTGLYAINRDALFRTGCRIGNNPLLYTVAREYAFDVDTMEDFREAEELLRAREPVQSGS